MPLIPDIKIRGIRTPIPSGYVLGRTQVGHGEVHLIPIDKIGGVAGVGGGGGGGGGGGSAGSGAGGGAGSSSGTGGSSGGGSGFATDSLSRTIATTALQLAQMGASNYGSGEADDSGGTTFIGLPGAAGATGAASTVPGPAGAPGIAIDGIDGEDGLPIPGSIGATGAAGAASTVPGPTGPPGIGFDGTDGEDGPPIPYSIPQTMGLGFVFDGSGSPPSAASTCDLYCPFACTIISAVMQADVSGSAVIDVWALVGIVSPTVSNKIDASAPPTLSTAQNSIDSTLTGWTRSIAAGTSIRCSVTSASTLTRVTLTLVVLKQP